MSHDRDWVEPSEIVLENSQEMVQVPASAYRRVLDLFENGLRQGAEVDEPEGERWLGLSDTLAKRLARDLRGETNDG